MGGSGRPLRVRPKRVWWGVGVFRGPKGKMKNLELGTGSGLKRRCVG